MLTMWLRQAKRAWHASALRRCFVRNEPGKIFR